MNCFIRACVFSLVAVTCSWATAEEEGWITLFNGKDLSGWKVNENKDSVRVDEGVLVINGPRAHAYYVGEDGKAEFKNFHFKAQVKTFPKANSGIYFHTTFQESGWPTKGYECQVNNTHGDPKKTGGLYNVQDNYKEVAKDGEWFDYDIMVDGKHAVVMINGRIVSAYTEPDDLNRPERMISSGTFALQAHDPGSKVLYRQLKVKRLPD